MIFALVALSLPAMCLPWYQEVSAYHEAPTEEEALEKVTEILQRQSDELKERCLNEKGHYTYSDGMRRCSGAIPAQCFGLGHCHCKDNPN